MVNRVCGNPVIIRASEVQGTRVRTRVPAGYCSTTNTTRRFLLRPSRVTLSATG